MPVPRFFQQPSLSLRSERKLVCAAVVGINVDHYLLTSYLISTDVCLDILRKIHPLNARRGITHS